MTKIGVSKNRRFFDAKFDVDSFACFDEIFLEKKTCNAIAIPEKKYPLRHFDLKIARNNWIFSKYDMQIW